MRIHSSSLLALCAALVACADGTTRREIAAPDEDFVLALARPVGDSIFPLVPGRAWPIVLKSRASRVLPTDTRLGGAQLAAAQATAAGRGSGDAQMTYLGSLQTYTFTVQGTVPSPAATGTIHVSISNATVTMEIDATLDCFVTVGSQAWVSGPVTLFVFNGVVRPATIHLLFEVQDNGEGNPSPPDLVSPPFGAGPQACVAAQQLPMFMNGGTGKIQLKAR